MKKILFALAIASAGTAAAAHDGHGLVGPHWHATDALGFILAAVVAGAVAWWTRGK